MADRSLLRRAYLNLRQAAVLRAQRKASKQAADRLHSWHVRRNAVAGWKAAAARSAAVKKVCQRAMAVAVSTCWQRWRIFHQHKR